MLTVGMLSMFDIREWPVVAKAVERKVARYGLPPLTSE
jgi:hypothetical protein